MPPKRRVTAIRSLLKSGLFDQGVFVDILDNQIKYEVQELFYATDKDCYENGFFVTKEEEYYTKQKSKFVTEIEDTIFDSLFIMDDED